MYSDENSLNAMKLFEGLLADEEGHIDFLETQIDLFERLGEAGYMQVNAAAMDKVE